jgi:hypothetical protein
VIPTPEFEFFYQEVLKDYEFITAFNKKTGSNIIVGNSLSERDNKIFTAYLRKFYETHFGVKSTTNLIS